MDYVTTTTKTALTSKINIGAIVTALSAILTIFGLPAIAPEMVDNLESLQVAILTAISLISAVYNWIMRTYFTTELTPQSAAKLPR